MRGIVIRLCAAFAILSSTSAWGQQGAVEIPFAPDALATFAVEEVRTRTSTDQRGPNGIGRVSATLEIVGGAPPYQAIWTTHRVEAGGQVIDGSQPGAANLLIGMPVSITLDESGAPQAIADWEGLRQRVFHALRDITPENERTAEWQRAIEATERMFASMNPNTAAQTMFPDISIMSLCQHTGLTIGQPLRSETMTPNVLGGPPIRTSVSYELQQVDRSAGLAKILFTSSLDPASAMASMRETVERVTRETGRDPAAVAAEFEGVTLNHDARAECSVDLQTGVTRSVTHRVTVSMGAAGRRTDERIITISPR